MARGRMRIRSIFIKDGFRGLKRMGFKNWVIEILVKYRMSHPNVHFSRRQLEEAFVKICNKLFLKWVPREWEGHDVQWIKEKKETELMVLTMQKDLLPDLEGFWLLMQARFPFTDITRPTMEMFATQPPPQAPAPHDDYIDPFLTPFLSGEFETTTGDAAEDEGYLGDLDDDKDDELKNFRRTPAQMKQFLADNPHLLQTEANEDEDNAEERNDDGEPVKEVKIEKKNKNGKRGREDSENLEDGLLTLSLGPEKVTRKMKKAKRNHIPDDLEAGVADGMEIDG